MMAKASYIDCLPDPPPGFDFRKFSGSQGAALQAQRQEMCRGKILIYTLLSSFCDFVRILLFESEIYYFGKYIGKLLLDPGIGVPETLNSLMKFSILKFGDMINNFLIYVKIIRSSETS